MGLFSWLNDVFDGPKTVRVDNKIFGNIEYTTGNSVDGEDFEMWTIPELQTPLAPTAITIFIDTSSEGPTEKHQKHLEKLYSKFAELQDAINRALFAEWSKMSRDFGSDGDMAAVMEKVAHFRSETDMPKLFELSSIALDDNEEDEYELGYIFRDEYPIWPDLELYFAVSRDGNVEYSGGAD
jgi:hypothetical protein